MTYAYTAMKTAKQIYSNPSPQYHRLTGRSLFQHVSETAAIVASIGSSNPAVSTDTMVATCWLSHSMDYCSLSPEFVRQRFGRHIANGVTFLSCTQLSDLSLPVSSLSDEEQLARLILHGPQWVQVIKAVDLLVTAQTLFSSFERRKEMPAWNKCNKLLLRLKQVDSKITDLVSEFETQVECACRLQQSEDTSPNVLTYRRYLTTPRQLLTQG